MASRPTFRIVFIAVACTFLPSCGRDFRTVLTPQAIFKKLLPQLTTAKSVTIACWHPKDKTTDGFTQAAGDGLAGRLKTEGFQPSGLGTKAKSSNLIDSIAVHHTPSDQDANKIDEADITIYIRMKDHSLQINQGKIKSSFSGTLWVLSKGSKTPFEISWSRKVETSGQPPTNGQADEDTGPTTSDWKNTAYPTDEIEREAQFAVECGAAMLESINLFGK